MTFREFTQFLQDHNLEFLTKSFLKERSVTLEEIFGPGRTKRVAEARREVWIWMRSKSMSFPEIGKLFNRDHTTVLKTLERHGLKVPKKRGGRGPKMKLSNHKRSPLALKRKTKPKPKPKRKVKRRSKGR